MSIELNYDTVEQARKGKCPIIIEDEDYEDECIELSLDQAKFIRDYIGYVIKKIESSE